VCKPFHGIARQDHRIVVLFGIRAASDQPGLQVQTIEKKRFS
jgi:hypothetical protein